MDKVKDAVGMGDKSQSGQEPVSGKQGDSAAGQPQDAGNSKEATKAADNFAGQDGLKPLEDAEKKTDMKDL